MPADIGKALPHYLLSQSSITALVSNRIRPDKLPPGEIIPAIVFQKISGVPAVQAHNEPSFLPKQRHQFTIYGETYEKCNSIAIVLKASLDGYRGNWGTGSFVTEVEACLFKDERSIDETELIGVYWIQQDYLIIWKE